MRSLGLLILLLSAGCNCGSQIRRVDAVVSFDPQVLDFGEIRAGTTRTLTLTLGNQGVVAVGLQSAKVTDDEGATFHTSALASAIAPSSEVTLNVTYAPFAEGSDDAWLSIATDGEPAEVRVQLLGRAVPGCPAGQQECNGACVDTQTDALHCGGCDQPCAARKACRAGSCVCQPSSCTTAGYQCGNWPDGCGGLLSCGSCGTGKSCDGTGRCTVVVTPRPDAGSGRLYMVNLYDGAVRISSDQGATWTQVGRFATGGPYAGAMTIDPDGRLYVIVSNGTVYRSDDSGATWAMAGAIGSNQLSITSDANGCLYATGYQGEVFRSADQGASWTSVGDWGSSGHTVTMAADGTNHLYVAEAAWGGGRVFLSTDRGATWAQQGAVAATGNNAAALACFTDGQLIGIQGGNTTPTFLSSDLGVTWADAGVIPDGIQKLAISAFDDVYSVSNNAATLRVFRSVDRGNTWTPQASFSNGCNCGAWSDIVADYPFTPLPGPCAP